MNKSVSILLLVFGFTSFASADGTMNTESDTYREQPSDLSPANDERLPPVLPGEEVQRGKTKMKVWSTSGGVSASAPPGVAAAPQAPVAAGTQPLGTGGIGVVVDGRDFVPGNHPRR